MSALALVQVRPLPGERLEPGDERTIGREGCDVLLDHPLVSRRHAVLRGGGDSLEIEDLGSRNGTFVNNERIEAPLGLAEGDELRIGETLWRVESAAAATASGQAPDGSSDASASRGDVPPPPPPSVVMPAPVQPPQPAAAGLQAVAAPFQEDSSSSGRRVSAARRLEATVISYAVVAATAAGVIAYLAAR